MQDSEAHPYLQKNKVKSKKCAELIYSTAIAM